MEERNQRLTRDWPAVDKRLMSGTVSTLRSWLLIRVPTLIFLCKPFSCKACPVIFYNFIMESRTISSATTPSDSVLTVDSSSSIVVDSTSSSAKMDSCSVSAHPSVVSVADSDVSEPAMAVLHTLASSGDDEAESSDDSSVTQEHVEQIDASSNELETLEAESIAAAAPVAAADAQLRFLRARRSSAQV